MPRGKDLLPGNIFATANNPGKYADGAGLYLYVEETGSRRWVLRYTWKGKERYLGLGSATKGSTKPVSLALARQKAQEARELLAQGKDPLEAAKLVPAFREVAEAYIAAHEGTWRNEKHRSQWRQTLRSTYAAFGDVPVNEVTTEHLLKALRPMWASKPETAQRTRGRVERVLDAARAKGLIPSPWENPARWRGHLEHWLPDPSKFPRGRHPALAVKDIPAFMVDLRTRPATAARALEWTILTAARTGETIYARWREIDRSARVWIVPGERMKAGREHRVPLSDAALAVLDRVWPARLGEPPPDAYVFPGPTLDRPLSNMAMRALLDRMKREDISVHGFRSTFRDWAGDETDFARELAEAALGHLVGDEVERAYRRGDALERRRQLMQAWADHCSSPCTPKGAEKIQTEPERDEATQTRASNVIVFPTRRRA